MSFQNIEISLSFWNFNTTGTCFNIMTLDFYNFQLNKYFALILSFIKINLVKNFDVLVCFSFKLSNYSKLLFIKSLEIFVFFPPTINIKLVTQFLIFHLNGTLNSTESVKQHWAKFPLIVVNN